MKWEELRQCGGKLGIGPKSEGLGHAAGTCCESQLYSRLLDTWVGGHPDPYSEFQASHCVWELGTVCKHN